VSFTNAAARIAEPAVVSRQLTAEAATPTPHPPGLMTKLSAPPGESNSPNQSLWSYGRINHVGVIMPACTPATPHLILSGRFCCCTSCFGRHCGRRCSPRPLLSR
jgi:hypothetical protein